MSLNRTKGLGVALGAAMVIGAPLGAQAAIVHVEAVLAAQPSAASDPADHVEEAWSNREDLADVDIDASMDGTRVVLEGEVRTNEQRQAAERVARRVDGVDALDNRIVVKPAERAGTKGSVLAGDAKEAAGTAAEKTGNAIEKAASATKSAVVTGAKATADAVRKTPEKIDETWITTKIAGKINADDALEHVDVDVKVKQNVVTITGDVPSTALRDRVLRIARETVGVERVIDQMTVKAGAR